MRSLFFAGLIVMIIPSSSCQNTPKNADKPTIPEVIKKADTMETAVEKIYLPEPYSTKSVKKMSKVIGWPKDKMPVAQSGFKVTQFADSLDNPRWIYVAGNGDVFVAESNSPHGVVDKLTGKNKSADKILLFRDTDNDGIPDMRTVFLDDLNKPFGMLIIGDKFYVANTDALMQYPYIRGNTSIQDKGKKILSLPAGATQRHWTRNIVTNERGDKIYISVGSSSNVAENGIDKEDRRACILQVNADGSGEKIYAAGLRNPVGMDWAKETNVLWTAVNERDELGDDLVPDYLTSVQEGGFYGWPYSYFGQHRDPRMEDKQRPDLVQKAIVPDVSLGAHTASLGLAFYYGKSFPAKYQNGAFIGQHGSWNRSQFSGYKVVFIPFNNGKPSGKAEDFLTGFIANPDKDEVYGRPVGVAVSKDGSLLVADDAGKKIWRISKS